METISHSHTIDFKPFKLPVSSLVIPLVIRKLSQRDCLPLFEKVKARILNWSAKSFWKGQDVGVIGAKINWSHICSLKAKGGLVVAEVMALQGG
ncbi:hypothetical protein J1N35_027880 [Gossypium stocksii]|uniref:Uncharacterized protein n=1 Tax=Gossypium stocksii TaxID=47602 RepID=A0A9D3VAN5_9ROSI|nr:hypothetical protein J1N35_027880 [Gossypium stocksii]